MSIKNPLREVVSALRGVGASDVVDADVIAALDASSSLTEFEKKVIQLIPDDHYDVCSAQSTLDIEAKAGVLWYWWRLS